MLNNTKNKSFTLVELLIVIVVIAILAAISIVAYNGVQNRGKASSAQTLASQVSKKAEMYNTLASSYPAAISNFADYDETKLDNSSAVQTTIPSDEKTVAYKRCAAGGAQVVWHNASGNNKQAIGIGGAPSGTVTALCA